MAAGFDLDTLRAQLRSIAPADLEPLARRFVREKGGDDVDFVVWLHEQGRIDTTELRDAVASLDVSFTIGPGLPAQPPRSGPRVLGLLGRGAMGEVHVARDEALRRNVALKRMHPRLAAEPELARRFQTEVQITAQLDHPAIVPVYGIERGEDGLFGYTMKLVRGRTLKEWLAEARAFAERGQRPDDAHALAARMELFLQVCEPVGYAHSRGVIHRDLKPENIMVGPFGEVFVMDWGIARLIGGTETISSVDVDGGRAEHTEFGMVVGTISYMSPEQSEGRNDDMDGRSDLFTLGLILFEMVTLRRARASKKGAAAMLVAAQRAHVDPIVPLSPREKVPRELAAVIRKATQKRRRDRYQTVEAMADDVRRYLRGQAVSALPDTPMQRLARWIAHHRDTSAAIGLGLVLLVLVVLGMAVSGGLVAREIGREAAARREARLADALAAVSTQARAMDRQLQRYEGLLHGLAFTTERALGTAPVPQPTFLASAFATPGKGPPDLAASKVYGPMSLDHVDLALAPGVEPRTAQTRLLQLASLQPFMRRVLLQSHAEGAVALPPADQRKLVGDDGVPVVWAYVALEEGILAGYPGTGVYPEGYDPRARPWYADARPHRVPRWGKVYLDESGLGLLLGCGVGLYEGPRLLGVAGIDVTVGYLVDTLLDPRGLPAGVEAYLVGEDGMVVVQSSLKEQARTGKDYVPQPLPWPQVSDAVRGGTPSGHATVGDDLLVWTRLDAMPWTYVVVGETEALLGG